VFGVIAVLTSVAALIAGHTSQETGPKLTHTITRGNLLVTVTEQGILESSENTEIKCQVRGYNTVIWVIDSGTLVKPGDELVRLDTLLIEEEIDERTKYAHWSRAGAEYYKARAARAELAVSEYEQGRYVSELATLEKDLAVAESRLRTARNMLEHAKMMFESDYVSELDVEEKEFAFKQAGLDLELKKTQIDVLKRFTKEEQLQTLRGDLAAEKAQYAANAERAMADASRRDRALAEFEHCVVKAEKAGLVIHLSAAEWENAPKITEGSTVHKDQVLLLLPDLSKMRVKVGVHESVIDRMKEGLPAKATLPDKTLDGVVSSVSPVTAPTGWWTGNEVRYDTFVDLPSVEGLRPGMSAEVEILIARYEDVLTIPVAAVVETDTGGFCWVKTAEGPQRRTLKLGDSNDVFTVVEAGLKEGDEVVLNPLAFGEARTAAAKTRDEASSQEPDSTESGSQQQEPGR
jgi:multidrug efflux pump subunit AcrA (membrane-fusion protein)